MEIQKRIISELKNPKFLDLGFLYSDEALKDALVLLRDLLAQERQSFAVLLRTPKEEITFDTFEDEGLLDYYWSLLNHLKSVDDSPKIRKIIETFRPELQEFSHEVSYSKPYYEMLVYCFHHTDLDKEQKRSLSLRIERFESRGIHLAEKEQTDLKDLNQELSKLAETFSNNILDDEAEFEYVIEDVESIKELPADILSQAKGAYQSKYPDTKKDAYLFGADPNMYSAIMKYCTDRQVRHDIERAHYRFAAYGKYDNRLVIREILEKKQKKATILGYRHYAELSLHDKMAESPEQVESLLHDIALRAQKKAQQELDTLKAYFHLQELETYDVSFYSRKYKEEKYGIDQKKLREYFEFGSVLTYLHTFAWKFLGVELRKIDVLTYSDEVRGYEVWYEGALVSYYMLDPFYRKTKRSGAWADSLRGRSYEIPARKIPKQIPIIVNVCNFSNPSGSPTLLDMYDVETLFHEFGHALHEMLSESQYSDLSGFEVEWDFVELPSQLLENWVTERESLSHLGQHFQTGDPLPEDTLDTLEKLSTYMTGYGTLRQCEFALLDMGLYAGKTPETVTHLEQQVEKLTSVYALLPRTEEYAMYCSFSHIFGGGYAAGYYSYMWAEILEAQVFAQIKQEGMFQKQVGKKLVTSILGQGTRKPAKELFYDFVQEDVSIDAFLERKGI